MSVKSTRFQAGCVIRGTRSCEVRHYNQWFVGILRALLEDFEEDPLRYAAGGGEDARRRTGTVAGVGDLEWSR